LYSPKSFSFKDRKEILENPRDEYDLVIVGGGIVGAGLAFEAGLAGYRCLLVEKEDFAWGTSSRSSKLIHGGLRYLEQFQFSVVKESLKGRKELLSQLPHLVQPLDFIFPIYKQSSWRPWKIRLGLKLYDWFAGKENLKKHQKLSKKELSEKVEGLRDKDLQACFLYQDAMTDDARLVMEAIKGAWESGCVDILNHVSFESWSRRGHKVKIELRDHLATRGQVADGQGNFSVDASKCVLAGGPWTDLLLRKGETSQKQVILPSKGVHLVLSKDFLKLKATVVMSDPKNNRILFVIPREHYILMGTTESGYQGDPSQVTVENSDIEYLKERFQWFFPQKELKDEHILSSYAGIRPLIREGSGKTGSEGRASREHRIEEVAEGVWYVAGGKYTTFRIMSHDVLEHVFHKKFEDHGASPLIGRHHPDRLKKLRDRYSSWAQKLGLSESLFSHWEHWCGSDVEYLVQKMTDDPSLKESLDEKGIWRKVHVFYSVEFEMTLSLKDLFCQRLHPFFLTERKRCEEKAPLVANWMAQWLDWGSERKNSELQGFLSFSESLLKKKSDVSP
jgi:glycerol-3-phosphate dehydrogenase